MALGNRSWDDWIAQYSTSHQNRINRACHLFGIPMIVASLFTGLLAIVWHRLAWIALGMFLFGWTLQFIGHAFEGKRPEFINDWRFLLVGTRWWTRKVLRR
jgi:uncharacterized membrane protein YGL010W